MPTCPKVLSLCSISQLVNCYTKRPTTQKRSRNLQEIILFQLACMTVCLNPPAPRAKHIQGKKGMSAHLLAYMQAGPSFTFVLYFKIWASCLGSSLINNLTPWKYSKTNPKTTNQLKLRHNLLNLTGLASIKSLESLTGLTGLAILAGLPSLSWLSLTGYFHKKL